MSNTSQGRYYIKKSASASFADITTQFSGVAILKVDGLLAKGEPVNIYNAQWINEQAEDYVIPLVGESENPVVIRKNVDIEVTFIIRNEYRTSVAPIDALAVHDAFIEYMTSSDLWIKSAYVGNKAVHCVCLSDYSPTTVKLDRGEKSYIMGTIKLHCLDEPS